MTSTTTASAAVGLWTGAFDSMSVGQVGDAVRAVESQGWPSLWFAEATGRDAFSTAWLLLAASERIEIGTGIANIWARDALASAAASRTLLAAHPGRFHLGLGVSHRPLVTDVRGHNYDRPLTAMRDYLGALSLSHATVPGEALLPRTLVAALGPRMTELAATHAQGAITFLTTPAHTSETRRRLGTGRRVVVHQAVVVSPGISDHEWRHRVERHLATYLSLENYRRSFVRQGLALPRRGDNAPQPLIDALVPRGLDASAARIAAHLEAGADEVVVQILGPDQGGLDIEDCAALARHLS